MEGNIVKADELAIKKAALIIKDGGLVAFPTETVYGLGADAFNHLAVAKIFEAKQRPFFDPLIVHIADVNDLQRLAVDIGRDVERLIQKFWPGPLTLVLKKAHDIPDIVTAGLDTVAIRMPAHPVAARVIRESGTPIAAPSANPFGCLSPTTAEHVMDMLGDKVDLIIDGGRCSVGVESTILDMTSIPTLLRPGGVPLEDIEKVVGEVKVLTVADNPKAPGQLPQHYSPRTPLKIIQDRTDVIEKGRLGLLAFKSSKDSSFFEKIELLSPDGDLVEAAANLFSSLHRLDSASLDIIYAEPVPEVGLGRAIMNRLRKAEHKD